MAETTLSSDRPSGASGRHTLERFDRGERVLHWTNASLFLILLFTGAALYVPALSQVVARRHLLKTIHVYAGLSLPVPLLLTIAARRWGHGFRADVRRLNRFSRDDRLWLRSRGSDRSIRIGKFNAGQKLNAAFTAGAIPVMLLTGVILRWPNAWPLTYRTGATFVHDWMFLGLVLTVTGHILFAINDFDSLRSMVRGRVSAEWARHHAPRWYEEISGDSADVPVRRRSRR